MGQKLKRMKYHCMSILDKNKLTMPVEVLLEQDSSIKTQSIQKQIWAQNYKIFFRIEEISVRFFFLMLQSNDGEFRWISQIFA